MRIKLSLVIYFICLYIFFNSPLLSSIYKLCSVQYQMALCDHLRTFNKITSRNVLETMMFICNINSLTNDQHVFLLNSRIQQIDRELNVEIWSISSQDIQNVVKNMDFILKQSQIPHLSNFIMGPIYVISFGEILIKSYEHGHIMSGASRIVRVNDSPQVLVSVHRAIERCKPLAIISTGLQFLSEVEFAIFISGYLLATGYCQVFKTFWLFYTIVSFIDATVKSNINII